MISMKHFIIITLLLISNQITASVEPTPIWGQTGHRVVGAVADQHLKGSTKRALKKLLNHESLAYVSTYADIIKSDSLYDKFSTWHYLNMPLDGDYATSKKNPEGDLVSGINTCKQIIKSEQTTKEEKAFYLKMLIHLIGDLHQPLHLGLEEDRGGNDFKVQWYYSDSNMHSVWDTKMIESFGMSYSELAHNLTYYSKDEIDRIQSGSVLDWIEETHILTKVVYESAEQGENLRGGYGYKHFDMVRNQLEKAGIRLAKVLNELF